MLQGGQELYASLRARPRPPAKMGGRDSEVVAERAPLPPALCTSSRIRLLRCKRETPASSPHARLVHMRRLFGTRDTPFRFRLNVLA
jgi:hypothetical protein